MKKISLKGISEILSERELKNVMGGTNIDYCLGYTYCDANHKCPSGKLCYNYVGCCSCCK